MPFSVHGRSSLWIKLCRNRLLVDTSVLLRNRRPLVKFRRNFIQDPRRGFSISSLVISADMFEVKVVVSWPRRRSKHSRIFLGNLPNDFQKSSEKLSVVYTIKRTLHGGLKIWWYNSYFLVLKTTLYSLAAPVRKDCFYHAKLKLISSPGTAVWYPLYIYKAYPGLILFALHLPGD